MPQPAAAVLLLVAAMVAALLPAVVEMAVVLLPAVAARQRQAKARTIVLLGLEPL